MKLGLYSAVLHDRSLPDAIQVVASIGLTGLEINTGGFLPAVHIAAGVAGVMTFYSPPSRRSGPTRQLGQNS